MPRWTSANRKHDPKPFGPEELRKRAVWYAQRFTGETDSKYYAFVALFDKAPRLMPTSYLAYLIVAPEGYIVVSNSKTYAPLADAKTVWMNPNPVWAVSRKLRNLGTFGEYEPTFRILQSRRNKLDKEGILL